LYAKKKKAIFDDVTNALDPRILRAVAEKIFGKDEVLRFKETVVIFATHVDEISDPLVRRYYQPLLNLNNYL